MTPKILARGAEAIITKQKNQIIKLRLPKGYRHPVLDEKLRKLRTRAEYKLLEKANLIINSARTISLNEQDKEITIEYLSGAKLADCLDNQKPTISNQIGSSIAKLHDSGIIHGDLTTSNMILAKNKKVYFIDFGLGFHSQKAEDKAVDIHVLKEALEARHPKVWEKVWKNILKAYTKTSPQSQIVLKQLERVERRGRYKAQY